ncbi:PREDICTED: 28S ribosomal protein S26, mitochondrial [Gekko japonicus]|uniref:Small ribosomal subunit protein mS26 n=1 Tax=Gekko japonicus TaxID=146911 RepID=A0ABM1L6C1_GEKJA|nr:PREDICTED: 28S ribosomal protein S26, mitochondrial [Gekko japonicus]
MRRGIVASPGPASALLGRCFPGLPLLAAPRRGRKSRTDPPAKSKLGRIKLPPPVDPAELLVVQERYRHYLSILRTLRAEFRHEVEQRRYAEKYGDVGKQRKEAAMEEHRQLMAFNDAENRRLQQRREERLRREEAEVKERRLRGDQNRALHLEKLLEEREREVLQLQEEAKDFVTLDNLEEKIEECLNNPRNYNFAVDKDGRVAKRSVLS